MFLRSREISVKLWYSVRLSGRIVQRQQFSQKSDALHQSKLQTPGRAVIKHWTQILAGSPTLLLALKPQKATINKLTQFCTSDK